MRAGALNVVLVLIVVRTRLGADRRLDPVPDAVMLVLKLLLTHT